LKQTISDFTFKIRRFFSDFQQGYPRVMKVIRGMMKLIKWGIIAGIVLLLSLILFVRFGFFRPLPSHAEIKKIQNPIASEVYAADGELLGRYYLENRTNASIREIPQSVIDALVATEDVRFFEHNGIDFRSLLRVFWVSIVSGDSSGGGGSTISQQLAKNIYGRKSMRYVGMPMNKVWEMMSARRLEKVYAKDEILELYLNTVSFGEDVYGIETAAERYFNTEPENLRLEDGAVLVGMLKATTAYNPRSHPKRAKFRRNIVFHQMNKYEYLDTTTMDSLMNLEIELDYNYMTRNTGLAPHFREQLRLDLEKICGKLRQSDGTNYNIYTDGLKIYTTLNSKMQRYAEKAVQTHMKSLQKTFFEHWKNRRPWGKDDASIRSAMRKTNRYNVLKEKGWTDENIEKHFKIKTNIRMFTYDGEVEKQVAPWDSIIYYHQFLNTGFMAMNPKNGHVQAYVGSVNFQSFQYDHVFSKRQVGSTFKPIVYARAIENGRTPCDYIPNEKITYAEYQNWTPGNSDGKYGGYYSIKGGLTNSVNTIAVQLMMESGISEVKMLAKKMGITSDLPNVPSIALGTADISLYEMMQVYATFANRGQPIEPIYLTKIEDRHGKILKKYDDSVPKANVISKQTADYMIEMMESVVDSGTARRLRFRYGITGTVAGKTGTTQNQSDGWFMGITPNIVAGVWVGGYNRKIRFRSTALGQGANMALPIWGLFMKDMQRDKSFNKITQVNFPTVVDSLSLKCGMHVDSLVQIDFGDGYEYLEEDELEDYLKVEGVPEIELTEEQIRRLEEIQRQQSKRKRKAIRKDNWKERKEDAKERLRNALKKRKG
jgi:penicillin-binding protein 1A